MYGWVKTLLWGAPLVGAAPPGHGHSCEWGPHGAGTLSVSGPAWLQKAGRLGCSREGSDEGKPETVSPAAAQHTKLTFLRCAILLKWEFRKELFGKLAWGHGLGAENDIFIYTVRRQRPPGHGARRPGRRMGAVYPRGPLGMGLGPAPSQGHPDRAGLALKARGGPLTQSSGASRGLAPWGHGGAHSCR